MDLGDDQGRQYRPDRLSRGKEAVAHFAHLEDIPGDNRHHRIGRSEKGGYKVQQHGRKDDRTGEDEPEAFPGGREVHPGGFVPFLGDLPDHHQGDYDRQEGNGIEEIGIGLPKRGDDHSSQHGADDRANIGGDGGHTERIRQVLRADQVGDHRLAGRQIKGNDSRLQGGQSVNVPELDRPDKGQQASAPGRSG